MSIGPVTMTPPACAPVKWILVNPELIRLRAKRTPLNAGQGTKYEARGSKDDCFQYTSRITTAVLLTAGYEELEGRVGFYRAPEIADGGRRSRTFATRPGTRPGVTGNPMLACHTADYICQGRRTQDLITRKYTCIYHSRLEF